MLEDAGNRVREPEPNGVQGLATELRGSWIVESFAAIDGIADQGMAQDCMCTRIWWVLPVARLHSSKVARTKRRATLKRVKAGRPVGTTAIRVRCRGSRPTGALTSPSSLTTPCTRAR